MANLIKDTGSNYFFKGFGLDGSLLYTDDKNEALDLAKLEYQGTTSPRKVKAMLTSWYGKEFFYQTDLIIETH